MQSCLYYEFVVYDATGKEKLSGSNSTGIEGNVVAHSHIGVFFATAVPDLNPENAKYLGTIRKACKTNFRENSFACCGAAAEMY